MNEQDIRQKLMAVDLSDGVVGFTHLDKRDVELLMPVIEAYGNQRELEGQLAVASNAKVYTNRHGATYVVFATHSRDISQNELKAILHMQLDELKQKQEES